MALATKPKPGVSHRKRRAQHHKQSKHYLKTYWPYLPMLMIVGIGLAINNFWSSGIITTANSGAVISAGGAISGARPVSRIEAMAGNSPETALGIVLALSVLAFVTFMIRHSLRLRRVLVKSEAFVVDHALLDILLVATIVAGVVLTRNA